MRLKTTSERNTLRAMMRLHGQKTILKKDGTEVVIDWWRSVWKGSNPSGPAGGGARECARRRRQILKGTLGGFAGGVDGIFEARELENPKVILLGEGKKKRSFLDYFRAA